jgi:hypothetical protein
MILGRTGLTNMHRGDGGRTFHALSRDRTRLQPTLSSSGPRVDRLSVRDVGRPDRGELQMVVSLGTVARPTPPRQPARPCPDRAQTRRPASLPVLSDDDRNFNSATFDRTIFRPTFAPGSFRKSQAKSGLDRRLVRHDCVLGRQFESSQPHHAIAARSRFPEIGWKVRYTRAARAVRTASTADLLKGLRNTVPATPLSRSRIPSAAFSDTSTNHAALPCESASARFFRNCASQPSVLFLVPFVSRSSAPQAWLTA